MKDIEYLKQNGIDVNSGLELLGDMEMYDETLEDFLNECETRLPDLEKYKNSGDMANYAIQAHSMKSDSKYLGFTTLAKMSLNHEMKSKDNDINYVNSNYENLIIEAKRIISIVNHYLGK
ncbi:MAG: Hpt domain-containing protein [Bacilli bacterium]|nr:Hpt domain-containing protein [Bacilli bacterium]